MSRQGRLQGICRNLAGTTGSFNEDLIAAAQKMAGETGLTFNQAVIALAQNQAASAQSDVSGCWYDLLATYGDAVMSHRYVDAAALPAAVTFTRASQAWLEDETSYASGAPRVVSGSGFRVEESRTQYLDNPATPATQTKSLAAGDYILFVQGTGSVALSGGPTGTATEGSPVTFTLAGTTSVTFTVSGALDWFNVQNGSVITSPILATAAGTVRAADVATMATSAFPFNASEGTVVIEWETDIASYAQARGLFHISDDTLDNRIQAFISGSSNKISYRVTAAALSTVGLDGSASHTAGVNKLAVAYATDDFAAYLNGAQDFTDTTVTPPSSVTVLGLFLGISGFGGQQINGWGRRFQYYPRRLSNAELQAVTA